MADHPDTFHCAACLWHALRAPSLAAADPEQAARAMCDLAVALGRCRLFGVVTPELGTLPAEHFGELHRAGCLAQ